MATVELDAEFWTLPLETVRSAALDRARALGCEHAEARIERIRSQVVSLRDGRLETSADDLELGVGLRVVHEGSFGFAATVELDADAAAELADKATRVRRRSHTVNEEPAPAGNPGSPLARRDGAGCSSPRPSPRRSHPPGRRGFLSSLLVDLLAAGYGCAS